MSETAVVKPEKGFVNRDECVACQRSGDLVLCDRCPASFHFQCLAPPQRKETFFAQNNSLFSPKEEAEEGGANAGEDAEWFCIRCRYALVRFCLSLLLSFFAFLVTYTYNRQQQGQLSSPKNSGPLAKTLAYVSRANPKEFAPPAYIKKHAIDRTRDKDATTDDGGLAARGPVVAENTCTTCGRPGTMGTLVRCSFPMCGQQPHLWCAEPALLLKPPFWQCDRHDEVVVRQDVVPSETFTLSFGGATGGRQQSKPPPRKKARGAAGEAAVSPAKGNGDDDADMAESESPGKSLHVHERLARLQSEQHQVMSELSSSTADPQELASHCAASLAALSDLSPAFVQFLAWQRLAQFQQLDVDGDIADFAARSAAVAAVPNLGLGLGLELNGPDAPPTPSDPSVNLTDVATVLKLPVDERRPLAAAVYAHAMLIDTRRKDSSCLAEFRDEDGLAYIPICRPRASLGRRSAPKSADDSDEHHIDLRALSTSLRGVSRNQALLTRDEVTHKWALEVRGAKGQVVSDTLYPCDSVVPLSSGDRLKFGDVVLNFHPLDPDPESS
jgi:PHD-finger